MSELRIAWYTMPSATLGPSNPLPPLKPYSSASSGDFTCERYLPYRTQDRYDRVKTEMCHKVAILENDRLRATFLLNLGGRLWSLFHKPTNRELLMCNPVFQPANLAIRNAWFSGGIEWNVSKFGHCPFTCSPLHAAEIEGPNGEPVLRLYEYERCRDIPFQIDFYLPDGSDYLFSSPRITNPHGHEIPMYWWSNIAVVESSQTRVLAPADSALGHDYDESGARKAQSLKNNDLTYPSKWPSAIDLYFVIPKDRKPWEASIEADGKGLLHISSQQLYGRKMFVWGMNGGGRRWQEFLSQPGSTYLEIQGGLAHTQGEYVRMPAETSWSWLEAFGPIQADPKEVFGEWDSAWRSVDAVAKQNVPDEQFDSTMNELSKLQLKSPKAILHQATGWGYLETKRRELQGAPNLNIAEGLYQREAVTAKEQPWLDLLEKGVLPIRKPEDDPGEYIANSEWKQMLLDQNTREEDRDWHTWLHLGIAAYYANNTQDAISCWKRANVKQPSAWAHRNLAVAYSEQGDENQAWQHYREALKLLPTERNIALEASSFLIDRKRTDDLAELASKLDDSIRNIPRIKLALAYGALYAGKLDEVEVFFQTPFQLEDLREGDNALSDLWFDYQAMKIADAEGVPLNETHKDSARKGSPPPKGFDFRMHIES